MTVECDCWKCKARRYDEAQATISRLTEERDGLRKALEEIVRDCRTRDYAEVYTVHDAWKNITRIAKVAEAALATPREYGPTPPLPSPVSGGGE